MEHGLRIAFVGKRQEPKTIAAHYLYKKLGFKRMLLEDGVIKLIRDMYTYKLHKRVPWEQKKAIYDALYKIDPNIHIDYLLRKLITTERDVIVPDARYLNEVKKLREVGFIIIRLNIPATGPIKIKASTAAAGTVMLQEYFGKIDAYPVDYSILGENRFKIREMLDVIIEKERAKIETGRSSD
jgi:hypothetical protein